jgi:hypothetical protein
LNFAEENPTAVLEILEDRTDMVVRELEARQRDASRALRETPFPPEAFDDRMPESRGADSVPF